MCLGRTSRMAVLKSKYQPAFYLYYCYCCYPTAIQFRPRFRRFCNLYVAFKHPIALCTTLSLLGICSTTTSASIPRTVRGVRWCVPHLTESMTRRTQDETTFQTLFNGIRLGRVEALERLIAVEEIGFR
jgi:hypothetical protein